MERVGRLVQLALEREAAGVRLVRAAEHLHQRAFTGAVFADERVDLPGANLETDAVERHRRAKPLGHPLNPQPRLKCAGVINGHRRSVAGAEVFL